jgi:hypothetical protein
MDLQEAIIILENHQKWRKGADTKPTDSKKLSIAIDIILKELKKESHEDT